MNAPTLKKIFQFLFYLFAVAMLIATGMRTYSLLLRTTENVITAIFGLVAFEIGMLIWLAVAIFVSQGTGQRAVSFMASAFNLLLVIAATALDVMLESTINATAINREQIGWYVLWTIIAATAINVIMLWLSHILDPHAAAELRRRGVQDAINEQVNKEVEAKTPDIAKQAAAQISVTEIARAVSEYTNQLVSEVKPTQSASPSPVTTFARDAEPMITASAGGQVQTFTREDVDAMIADAIAKTKPPSRSGDPLKESLDFVLWQCEKNDWDKKDALDFSWDGAPIGDLKSDPTLSDQLIAEINKRGYYARRNIGWDFFVVSEGRAMWEARQPAIEIDSKNPKVKIK